MPVSEMANIPAIMREVEIVKPRRIIDLGCGFGKYGVLCREVLEAVNGRCSPDKWLVTIDGVEAFGAYKNPCWDVYSNVIIADFTKLPPTHFASYDLALVIDSLEHLEKEVGKEFLAMLRGQCEKVIVSVPDGVHPQGAVFGNEYERHRGQWTRLDLEKLGGKVVHHATCVVAKFVRPR